LPIIAEDLGVITPGVRKLRKDFGLPGMKVLQFGFEGTPDDEFLPHNYPQHCVVYTGTHDNDTVVGWYESVPEEARDFCRRYLGRDGTEIAWDLIRAAWSSVAQWAIAPLQDVLNLGSQARMNYPSREHGNWGWRVRAEQLTEDLAERLAALNRTYGRLAPAAREEAGG
jgi:4-alpha-glucanotransferase